MKNLVLSAAFASLLTLSACGDKSSSKNEPVQDASMVAEAAAKAEYSQVISNLQMESLRMAALLKRVKDGPSAKASLDSISAAIPSLNAAIEASKNIQPNEKIMTTANKQKMLKAVEGQAKLLQEVIRIKKNPAANKVLQKELKKIGT